jgi:biofilm PGA synthesis N-glycosyltransferase PgaC
MMGSGTSAAGTNQRNTLYPSDRIEILVASDGSTDATAALAEGLDDSRVRALAFSQRRGKTRTLVDAVQHVHSDVILFTDAQGS